MRRLFLMACVLGVMPGADVAAQTPGAKAPVLSIQMFEAHERDQGGRTYTGLSAEVARAKVARRYTMAATLRSRVRWTAGGPLAGDVQSLESRGTLRLSPRTTLTTTGRASYAARGGDDRAAETAATSGWSAGTTAALTRAASRRTTLGITYHFDRAGYAAQSRSVVTHGVGTGVWRAVNHYLTLQVGYDFTWSRQARSHAAVAQAIYRLPRHEGTSVTVTLKPTTSLGSIRRTTVLAGTIRLSHQLSETQRVALAYERSVSLLDLLVEPVVANVISGQFDARVQRFTTLSASAYYSAGSAARPDGPAQSHRLHASARVIAQLPTGLGLFAEFTRVDTTLDGSPVASADWSFSRTTFRLGATMTLGGVR
jgi:hypothetical protein